MTLRAASEAFATVPDGRKPSRPASTAWARQLLGALLAVAAGTAGGAQTEPVPLWELGVGAAALNFPDYRGAGERRTWLLPFPYLVYRGDFLRADERRMRGVMYETARFDVDVSLNGAVPVDSSRNEARRGMPDLDATAEIGPSLNFLLARSADEKTRFELRLPARAVLASDFSHIRHVGWLLQPNINLEVRDPFGHAGWKAGFTAGPLYGDRRYHRYYYTVEPAFATATRPAYSAGGGYSGAQAIASLTRRYGRYWIGGFVKWDTVHGAAFAGSPLVREKHGLSAGIAVARILGVSRTLVDPKR
jgi:MipA family protein